MVFVSPETRASSDFRTGVFQNSPVISPLRCTRRAWPDLAAHCYIQQFSVLPERGARNANLPAVTASRAVLTPNTGLILATEQDLTPWLPTYLLGGTRPQVVQYQKLPERWDHNGAQAILPKDQSCPAEI